MVAEVRTEEVGVALLGPLELTVRGVPAATGGPKLRAIVAQLALAGGRVVSVDDLLFGVWGEDLPNTARNTLQYHVGVLRKALGDSAGALVTRDPGYALQAETDVTDFLALQATGSEAAAAGRHEEAAQAFTDALNLWRGPALADVREHDFAEARAVALEDQRLSCAEAWADAELACGHADAILSPLRELVAENPTRERLWEQLMVALYRIGRQDAALAAYQSARVTLDRELGVSPSARLDAVHQAVLRHDPALDPAPALRPAPQRALTRTTLVRSEPIVESPMLLGPAGARVVLGPDPVVLGRKSDCDLVLDDDRASRRHAEVRRVAGGFTLHDLGSTNGTYLNGTLITESATLTDGDRIGIGESVVRFRTSSFADQP